MRTRYTFDPETGLLADRGGETLGRVVSITIDDKPEATPERLGDGASRSGSRDEPFTGESQNSDPHTPRPTASQLERQAVERIWAYWLEASGKGQRLDSKRERIIRNALATVKASDSCDLSTAEEKVKRALLGLTLSPFHRGENDARKPYMEIRYGLKGRGDESDDERIEKACDWAAVYAPGAPSKVALDPDKTLRYLEEIREYVGRLVRDKTATTGRDRALKAYRTLADAGYTVQRLDRPPWARFAA